MRKPRKSKLYKYAKRVIAGEQELLEKWKEYKAELKANPIKKPTQYAGKDGPINSTISLQRPYTMRGFCVFLGISDVSWYHWRNGALPNRKPRYDLFEAMDLIKTEIAMCKYDGAAVGIFHAGLISRELDIVEGTVADTALVDDVPVSVRVVRTAANLYHPHDLYCEGPLYTLEQLEAGLPYVKPLRPPPPPPAATGALLQGSKW